MFDVDPFLKQQIEEMRRLQEYLAPVLKAQEALDAILKPIREEADAMAVRQAAAMHPLLESKPKRPIKFVDTDQMPKVKKRQQ